MKYLFTALLIIAHVLLFGQNNKSKAELNVKSGQIFTNGELSYYYENDKNGNNIFTKNDGMNGAITMLFVAEYDSLNRQTRMFFAHSNIGFSLSETVYEFNQIKKYDYSTNSEAMNSFDREFLNRINSREEFLQLNAIKDLLKGNKRLTEIEILDSAKNVLTEYYISEEGDTTSINTHGYNSKNEEVSFHYGTINSEEWTWDIYFIYDNSSNLLKSYRIASTKGIKDTTEVYNYAYDSGNRLISDNYYYKRKFSNRTDYIYDKQDHLIEEHFYEGDESNMKVIIFYKYDKKGNLSKKITKDFGKSGKESKEVNTYKLIYW